MQSGNLIDQVVNEIEYTFEEGRIFYKRIRSQAEKDPALEAKINRSSNYYSMIDDYFKIDANRIPGTKMIASAGPFRKYSLTYFLDNVVFNSNYCSDNPHSPQAPITQIIALGYRFSDGDRESDKQDFHDYCLTAKDKAIYYDPIWANSEMEDSDEESNEEESDEEENQYKKPTVERIYKAYTCYELSVTPINTVKYHSEKNTFAMNHGDIFLSGWVQSRLSVRKAESLEGVVVKDALTYEPILDPDYQWNYGEPKEVTVTLVSMPDNSSITLTEENKPLIWELYQQTLKSPTLIHCASGVGRTGHLILTFEIIRNYAAIFADNDAKKAGSNILDIVDGIRKVRPALVYTREQFVAAIRNADILYHYNLGLESKAEPVSAKALEDFRQQYPHEKKPWEWTEDDVKDLSVEQIRAMLLADIEEERELLSFSGSRYPLFSTSRTMMAAESMEDILTINTNIKLT